MTAHGAGDLAMAGAGTLEIEWVEHSMPVSRPARERSLGRTAVDLAGPAALGDTAAAGPGREDGDARSPARRRLRAATLSQGGAGRFGAAHVPAAEG